jgi:hypothetical protein
MSDRTRIQQLNQLTELVAGGVELETTQKLFAENR